MMLIEKLTDKKRNYYLSSVYVIEPESSHAVISAIGSSN